MVEGGYTVKGVLFDFDGTLTLPGALDFRAIKAALGCPSHMPVLEFIDGMEDEGHRREAMARLDQFEIQAACKSKPNTDAEAVVAWVKSLALPVGIITRNSRASVLRALENFDQLGAADFDLIITREDPLATKPSGEGIDWAARQWHLAAKEVLTVGDYIFDPQAGRAAGAVTVLLDPDDDPRLAETACDFRLAGLADLPAVIKAGRPLPTGKLPNDWLAPFLKNLPVKDTSVLIPPGVGEDVTAVQVPGETVVALKTDPITFATEAIGQYAVHVAANDIATSGATPRWLLTTLILPKGTTPSRVLAVMQALYNTAGDMGISLCGGHTEISDAVTRPVVVAMMAGTVKPRLLVQKKNMAQGDIILLTKPVAVEGTALIAREFDADLKKKGFTDRQIAEAKGYLEMISVVPEAQVAARHQLASAMHDVTEGGLATAVMELSAAGGHKISVALENVPVSKLTHRMCAAMGLDPMGVIGSGGLLISCRPEKTSVLVEKIQALGIAVTPIGRVEEAGAGVLAMDHGRPALWPEYVVDEITKLFD